MPNTFIPIDVPRGTGAGVPAVVGLTGHPKTFVLSGTVPEGGRYIVEGSNDGGRTWDILIDDDGTQVFFTTQIAGVKSADCVVDLVRVRSERVPDGAVPPVVNMGAPPAIGTNVFGVLDVPPANGVGAPLDLGLSVGPLKTFMLRGALPEASRYTILASMDGAQFDEIFFFTADQQWARSIEVMCRFLRVQRAALGNPPAITVGAEGLLEDPRDGGGGTGEADDLSISSDGEYATASGTEEEVFAEYAVPLSTLRPSSLVLDMSGIGQASDGQAEVSFRVRLGGTPGVADGIEIVVLDVTGTGGPRVVRSDLFSLLPEPITLVKVTGRGGSEGVQAVLRGFVLRFHAAG